MKNIGFYAKDKNNDLHQFEWTADNKFLIKHPLGMLEADPKEYEILEIGFFTAEDKEPFIGLSKAQLERRLVIMKQVANQLNDDLAKIGWADKDGFVNTCSVEEAGQDGNIGANLVNLFLIADTNNDHVEKHCLTDAENDALMVKKQPKWEVIDRGIEINEDFLPNSNLTYMIEFDGIDRFRATLEEGNIDRKLVGVEHAPKILHYKLDRPIEELTQADKETILQYRGIVDSDEVCPSDVFMEKSHITFIGTPIDITMKVQHFVKFENGETAEDLIEKRWGDIYLHSFGEDGAGDKEDLGGEITIKFIEK